MISMALNVHLHIEQVISSKEGRFELGFRDKRKGGSKYIQRREHRWDRYDR